MYTTIAGRIKCTATAGINRILTPCKENNNNMFVLVLKAASMFVLALEAAMIYTPAEPSKKCLPFN